MRQLIFITVATLCAISCAAPVNNQIANKTLLVDFSKSSNLTLEKSRILKKFSGYINQCEEISSLNFKCKIPPFDFENVMNEEVYCITKSREIVTNRGGNLLKLESQFEDEESSGNGVYIKLTRIEGKYFFCPTNVLAQIKE